MVGSLQGKLGIAIAGFDILAGSAVGQMGRNFVETKGHR